MAAIKWTGLVLGLLVVALVVLSLTGRKTFRVETAVAAPPEAVWAVVSDPASYPDWNPVFVAVDGVFDEGASVTTTVREPGKNDVQLTGVVVSVTPGREIHQRLGVPFVITSNHRWLIEPQGDGALIIQDEVDEGLMTWFWDSDWVEPTYRAANEALGAHAAALAGRE